MYIGKVSLLDGDRYFAYPEKKELIRKIKDFIKEEAEDMPSAIRVYAADLQEIPISWTVNVDIYY